MAVLSLLSTILGACLVLVSATTAIWDESNFDHNTYLDLNEQYQLFWTVLSETEIDIGLAVNSLGWVGFGISPTGGMSGADIVMAWIDDVDDEAVLQNRYGTGRSLPAMMTDQTNIELTDASKINGTTYLRFTRLIYPCDEHSLDIVTGTAKVIYAWNDAVPVDNTPRKHSDKGSEAVNLLLGESDEVPMPEEYETFDILLDNYEIPSKHTTYHCKLLDLPAVENTNHIIRFDPVVYPGNEGIVHHIVLFYCPAEYFNATEDVGREDDCDDWANMGFSATQCLSGEIWASWAVGGSDFYYPENVGFEFGGDLPGAMTHVVMQMHFDNPSETAGIIDNSGMRIYYTPELREHSATVVRVAVPTDYRLFIPPFMPEAHVNGYCTAECTEHGIPETGVYAFANFLHAHLLGRKLRLRHFRDGEELPFLETNDAYDFDYQQTTTFTEEVQILPGDVMRMDCMYDSSERDFMTFGGESTNEEMCMTFLYVYPKVNLTYSSTAFLDEFYEQWWQGAIDNGYSTGPANMSNWFGMDYDASSTDATDYWQSMYDNTDRVYSCRSNYESEYLDGATTVAIPGKDFEEYVPEDMSDCNGDSDDSDSGEGGSKKSSENLYEQWYLWVPIAVGLFILSVAIYMYVRHRPKPTPVDGSYIEVK